MLLTKLTSDVILFKLVHSLEVYRILQRNVIAQTTH